MATRSLVCLRHQLRLRPMLRTSCQICLPTELASLLFYGALKSASLMVFSWRDLSLSLAHFAQRMRLNLRDACPELALSSFLLPASASMVQLRFSVMTWSDWKLWVDALSPKIRFNQLKVGLLSLRDGLLVDFQESHGHTCWHRCYLITLKTLWKMSRAS